MSTRPTPDRVAELTLKAFDRALKEAVHNGHRPDADLQWVLDAWAQAAPDVARHLTYVRAALSPQAAEYLSALVSARPASKVDAAPARQAQSKVSAKVAAELIGISPQAVRLAAAQGRLTATRHPVTGEWRITREAVEQYSKRR